ncbi:hypothetical protein PSACC_01729 [Paramicrosporidium saccamoebae]|uniref:Uncharacterized protein n=1 Tax=Paramicrosporidium saccamoebae TaxID=1246581 RepID=A0A2H9TL28_9FUNG|nr:hypothetical protein PSACC_01729 [Paramicrosporidium saccamoebae]
MMQPTTEILVTFLLLLGYVQTSLVGQSSDTDSGDAAETLEEQLIRYKVIRAPTLHPGFKSSNIKRKTLKVAKKPASLDSEDAIHYSQRIRDPELRLVGSSESESSWVLLSESTAAHEATLLDANKAPSTTPVTVVTETTNIANVANLTDGIPCLNLQRVDSSDQGFAHIETKVKQPVPPEQLTQEKVDLVQPADHQTRDALSNLALPFKEKDYSSSEESSISEPVEAEEPREPSPTISPKKRFIDLMASPLYSPRKTSEELILPKLVYLGFSVHDEMPSRVTLGPAPYDSAEGESYVFFGSVNSSD